jgi:hypothetical protein
MEIKNIHIRVQSLTGLHITSSDESRMYNHLQCPQIQGKDLQRKLMNMELSLNPNPQLIHIQGAYFSNQKTLSCREMLHLISRFLTTFTKEKYFHMPPCHANLEKTEFFPKKTHKPDAKEFHYKEKEIATISACYCHEYEKND